MNRLAIAAALAFAAASARGADCALEYRFDYRPGDAPRFEVTLAFEADGRAETRLRMSEGWGGIRDFHRGVRDLRAAGSDSVTIEAPGRWTVRHATSGRVTVRYTLAGPVPETLEGPDFYRPRIDARHFHLFGHAAMVHPEIDDMAPLAACVAFEGLLQGWAFASSLGVATTGKQASFATRASPATLRSALFVGGDFRLVRRDLGERAVWIALRGTWAFPDARFADGVAAVIASHRRFFGDRGTHDYLVSLVPNGQRSGSTGGTGMLDAFAMHASADFTVPGAAFARIVAHEHVHNWIPFRIGRLAEDEARDYWFSEGFTEYLAHRLLVNAGLWTLDDYAAALSEVMAEHAVSPLRGTPNVEAAKRFWTDADGQRLPYLRGELLAIHWARRLDTHTTSLEALLRGLVASRPEGDPGLATQRLLDALNVQLGHHAERDHHAHIVRGGVVPMDLRFLGPCFTGALVDRVPFELGFDRASLAARRVTGVVAGSRAHEAGLRDGQEIVSATVQFGAADKPARMTVIADGARRSLSWLPAGRTPLPVMAFKAKPGAADDPECRRWIAMGVGTP